jgi:hypothetical protein
MRAFKFALTTTLKNIKEKLNGAHPSLLWSGRGYHIIQPIDCPIPLEQIKEFAALDKEPSNEFLQFAARYLSANKRDQANHPALKSCMLRVPGTLNSKCKIAGIDPEVKIIQKWDGYRPDFKLLLGSFYADLVGKAKELEQNHACFTSVGQNDGGGTTSIQWIENILAHNPIDDHRKLIVGLILSRYLVNIRHLNYDQAYGIIWEWLDRCEQLRSLEPSRHFFDHEVVKRQLKEAWHCKIPHMGLLKMKRKYPDLYKKLIVIGGDS